MDDLEFIAIKRDVVIRDFDKKLTSMNTGTFLLFFFECETNPDGISTIGTDFIVEVYPNGISHANEGFVSVKISTTQFHRSTLQCTLTVVGDENKCILPQSAVCEDGYNRINCLFERFVKHSTLVEKKEEVLPDDVLKVHCEINHWNNTYVIASNIFNLNDHDDVYMNDCINFNLIGGGPYALKLSADRFRDMHENLIRKSSENVVKIDNLDTDCLSELLDYLCSNSSCNSEDDTDTTYGAEYSLRCDKYATKIKAMSEHAPGLLGLAYLLRDHLLRHAVKQMTCHYVLEIVKKLRHIYIYSVPTSLQSSSTLTPEYLTFKSGIRLVQLQDIFDVLKLYIAAYEYHIEILMKYCVTYIHLHISADDIRVFMVLLEDYHDVKKRRENKNGAVEFQEPSSGSQSGPDETSSDESDYDSENNELNEELISLIESSHRLSLKGRMEFYR